MAEKIGLEVPATLNALSTVRMVLGGLGARLDFSLDDLDDLYLADRRAAAQAALEPTELDRLQRRASRSTAAPCGSSPATFRSAELRAQVAITPGGCLDLCMLLQRTVDDVVARGRGRRVQRRPRQASHGGRAHERPRRHARVNDPLDLEALPGQARAVPDEDEEARARSSARRPAADAQGRGRDDSEKLDQYLLRRYHLYGDRKAREQLITMYLPLVRSLARRYASRGEHFDDLVQVGAIGLIKAIDRFDLSRGVELTTYATPNIVGEIKRYFRDKGWSVRVPRGLQELNIRLNKVIDELVPKLQRSPTINELAEAANATPEEVLEALETSQAYNSVSLQASPNGEGGRGGRRPHRLPRRRRRGLRHDGGPHDAGARLRQARQARALHPPPALLRGPHAEPDRRARGHLADARLAPHPALAREAARGDRRARQPRSLLRRVAATTA